MQYRFLKEGEVIEKGDEFVSTTRGARPWEPVVASIGGRVHFTEVGLFRRPVIDGEKPMAAAPEPGLVEAAREVAQRLENVGLLRGLKLHSPGRAVVTVDIDPVTLALAYKLACDVAATAKS